MFKREYKSKKTLGLGWCTLFTSSHDLNLDQILCSYLYSNFDLHNIMKLFRHSVHHIKETFHE